jgi:Immunoglobulin-like domain of bacterial spore germination
MYALRVALLAVVGVVALTATGVRFGNHPAYVRVVIDFKGKLAARDVAAGGIVGNIASVNVLRHGVATRISGRKGQGVHVALQPGGGQLLISMNFAWNRFKYLSYAVVGGNRLAIDLWKSAPPAKAAEIRRGAGGCLTLRKWHITAGSVSASGREHGIFENTFQVVVRGAKGRMLGRKTVADGGGGPWSTKVRYTAAHRQAGTLEAVDFRAKDGALDCIAQVRVTLPAN